MTLQGHMQFRDRRAAGRQLAELVARLALDEPAVLGLPRGGVPVAYEVARVLGAPLDVLAVRKLGAPGHDEYAVGAIAEHDALVLNEREAARCGLTGAVLTRKLAIERRELARRAAAYHGARPLCDLAGRAVVVVDDGLATGLTMDAAARAVRSLGGAQLLVATPIASPDAIARVREVADDVIAVVAPPALHSVGDWYADFSQTTDDEVLELLARSRALPTGELRIVARP